MSNKNICIVENSDSVVSVMDLLNFGLTNWCSNRGRLTSGVIQRETITYALRWREGKLLGEGQYIRTQRCQSPFGYGQRVCAHISRLSFLALRARQSVRYIYAYISRYMDKRNRSVSMSQ